MAGVDTRNSRRDSILLLADLKLENDDRAYRVKIRNLSASGVMAEGTVNVTRGTRLRIDFRDAGQVWGSVAWREGDRFGIAFENDIDPEAVRKTLDAVDANGFEVPSHIRNGISNGQQRGNIRKI